MKFIEKLTKMSRENNSLLCLGLDPDPLQMPQVSLSEFLRGIIDATRDLVCAYKPNFAFFEAQEIPGMEALKDTITFIGCEIPIIADAKRGDIGNTSKAYASSIFDVLGCDAATVNPYLGYDSLEPFLKYENKGTIILCRTSNKGARDFQDIKDGSGRTLYENVAIKAREWNVNGNIGLVVGATYPDELKTIRQLCPDMPILIPGVGSQGGDLELAIRNGTDASGEKAIINVSRQVLYASSGKDFAQAARRNAQDLVNKIRQAREKR